MPDAPLARFAVAPAARPFAPLRFPEGFVWGSASAGHQVEGGNVHSNWWAWEQQGLTNDGSRSGRACDVWNRYAEDHTRMRDYGFGMSRLGVEWARVEPEPGRFDEAALERYRAMLLDLQAKGMRVCLTLHHWVLPRWFAAAGGWLAPDAVTRFDAFVRRVARALGDLVDLWITLNEPMVPVLAGYLAGYHPPCRRAPLEAARVFEALLRAHAAAYHAIHAIAPRAPDGGRAQVGFAGAYQNVEPYHERGPLRALETPVARIVAQSSFRAWDESVRDGRVRWPFRFGLPFGSGRPIPGLAGSVDFVGVNYYMRISVRLGLGTLSNVKSGGYDCPPGIERTEMGWQVHPPSFHAVLLDVHRFFGKPIYVTENGCCDSGDEMRRRYLLQHLAQVQRAIADGADVRGYLLWTFLDNFEWREGFEKKFGIVAVDPDDPDLVRRPKPSAEMYAEVIAANAITPGIVARFAPGALDRWPLAAGARDGEGKPSHPADAAGRIGGSSR